MIDPKVEKAGGEAKMSDQKTDFRLIEEDEINSPSVELYRATGRARCRICGKKIIKGDLDVQFYHSFTDGSYNPWTSVLCHAHKKCVPNIRIEYDRS